jgi:hypothetical protein
MGGSRWEKGGSQLAKMIGKDDPKGGRETERVWRDAARVACVSTSERDKDAMAIGFGVCELGEEGDEGAESEGKVRIDARAR